jgi:hypothetical protein
MAFVRCNNYKNCKNKSCEHYPSHYPVNESGYNCDEVEDHCGNKKVKCILHIVWVFIDNTIKYKED